MPHRIVPPLPRKIDITYKQKPGTPRYTILIHSLDRLSEMSPQLFEFKAPAGAEEIDTIPLNRE